MPLVRCTERGGGGLGQGVLDPALFAEAGLVRTASGWLEFGGIDLTALAAQAGTPAFVYSAEVIRRRYRALDQAFSGAPHRIYYAVKANGNLSVLRLLRQLGARADIVSAGELARVMAAGFPADWVVFSGVGKRPDELELAADAGVGSINAESLEELARLGQLADRLGRPVRVGVRFNPDVAADTHPFISTGQSGIKFGIPAGRAGDVARMVAGFPRLELVTIAIHLGSQVLSVEPYREGGRRLVALLAELRALGVTSITALDIGGGLGIRYGDEESPGAGDFAAAVLPLVQPTGLTIQLEPGRSLVGAAGILLTRVLYRKQAGGKDFVVVDAGMTELVRPSRYGAYHHIVPARARPGEPLRVDVVGPVCETGDFLALDRPLDPVEPGDVLAVLGSGAYAFVMASQYNGRPRPPEILIEDGVPRVVRRRETIEDLLRGEE